MITIHQTFRMETNYNSEYFEEEHISSTISKKNNFSVPADYFDYLPEKIMNRIHAKEQKKIFFLLKPAFTIPSLAVLSGIIVTLFFIFHKTTAPDNLNLLSDNDVQQVINNPGLYNIDESAITDQYISSSIATDSMNVQASVSDEEIKSYLEDNSDISGE